MYMANRGGAFLNRAKPKSLFAQQSAKKFDGENVLGARSAVGQPFN